MTRRPPRSAKWKDAVIGALAVGWLSTLALFLTNPPTRPAPEPPPNSRPLPGADGPNAPEEPSPEPAPSPTPTPSDPPTATDRALADLRATLDAMQAAPGFESAGIGFCLLDENGEELFGHHADAAMIPASTLKTLTAASALEILGPMFQWETRVLAQAPPDADGLVAGDLVLQGSGDPTLSTADLLALADELVRAGVRAITGSVVGHSAALPEHIADDFWNWGDVGNYYGAGAAGLNVDHNRFAARFAPAATEGEPARFLGPDRPIAGVRWINRVTTGPPGSGDGVVIFSGPYADTITLRGTVPAGEESFEASGSVPDPPFQAAAVFTAALQTHGIRVGKPPTSDRRLADADSGEPPPAADASPALPPPHLLASHRSAPLIATLEHLLEVSDNLESECLFRLLGERGDARNAPDSVVRRHWAARGLKFSGLRMEDGSGLARANHIRPRDLARLQFLAASGPEGARYRSILPLQMNDTVRWKGGAMSGVRAYTGLLTTSANRELAFALMINHYQADADTIRHWRTTILESARNIPPRP